MSRFSAPQQEWPIRRAEFSRKEKAIRKRRLRNIHPYCEAPLRRELHISAQVWAIFVGELNRLSNLQQLRLIDAGADM